MSTKLTEYMGTPTASLNITSNNTYDVVEKAEVVVNVVDPTPVEISTDAGMTAVLTSANVGKCYMFTGTTGTYTNGDLYIVEDVPYYGLTFTANTAGSTIAMSVTGTPTLSQNFQYSLDKTTWTTFTPGTTTITLSNAGDKVYFKGDNPDGINDYSIYYQFVMTGSIAGSGNIMSLIDDGACTTTAIPKNYCFKNLFKGCALTTAPTLPATTLVLGCYQYLFVNTLLTQAPELPATTLANSCYEGMFGGCTALTTPPALPATTLARSCYYSMFGDCTALTTAPTLSATTLADSCYYGMFEGCISLTSAPELPATSVNFNNPYTRMFRNCTSLTTAPALPATGILGYGCYSGMFYGCTSLTTPPALPCTVFTSSHYSSMFYGCTALYVSDTATTEATHEWRIPTSGTNTGSTCSMTLMFKNCLGTRSSDTMAGEYGQSYTYYTQNEPV